MSVERDAWSRPTQQSLEGGFANLDRLAAQILAIKLKQIECAEGYAVIVLPPADHFKYGQAPLVAGNRLAVHYARSRRQSCDGCNDQRKTASEVMTVTSNQSHACPIAVREDAEAVVLDLMKPARSRGRVGSQARQAWIEMGVGLIGAQPVPKLTLY